mgnify:CR=1 FL=1
MAIKKITVTECRCERCGHVWTARVERPATCAQCRSPYWDRPRQKATQTREAKRRC